MDSNSYSADHPVDPATESLIAARDRMLGPAYRLFYERPVHLVRGEGARLYDADGACYLDAYNNVACVGHCHPHVVEAVSRQLSTLNTHTRYLHGGIVDYAERLLATMPEQIDQVMFACTGSEANDLAAAHRRNAHRRNGRHRHQRRLPRQHRGGHRDLAVARRSDGRSARTSAPIAPPDSYRIPAGELAARFADDVVAAIADLEGHRTPGFSALIVDTIFSSDGIYADPSVLAPARARRCAARAGCSSPTRCSPASAAPASRCGASAPRRRARHRDDGQADGQRAADRGDGGPRRSVLDAFAAGCRTSTPSAAIRCRCRRRRPCST